MKQKLENRKNAIKGAALTTANRAKVMQIFLSPNALDYIFSEESDTDEQNLKNGPPSTKHKTTELTKEKTEEPEEGTGRLS